MKPPLMGIMRCVLRVLARFERRTPKYGNVFGRKKVQFWNTYNVRVVAVSYLLRCSQGQRSGRKGIGTSVRSVPGKKKNRYFNDGTRIERKRNLNFHWMLQLRRHVNYVVGFSHYLSFGHEKQAKMDIVTIVKNVRITKRKNGKSKQGNEDSQKIGFQLRNNAVYVKEFYHKSCFIGMPPQAQGLIAIA
jgi:hypothetical protein